MRVYKLGIHTKKELKVHGIWISKYREELFGGAGAIRVRGLLGETALQDEIENILIKVSIEHISVFISYQGTQNISKIVR